MRRLVVKMSVSVDGFVSGPNGEADWIFSTGGDDARAWVLDTLRQAGVHAMGSRTYRDMAAFWPTADSPLAPAMNDVPKVVFTRKRLADATDDQAKAAGGSWANPIVASGPLADEVARLKAEPGKDILAPGGASFVRDLAAHGLVDEYRLLVHPVALGTGLPIFSGLAEPLYLTLASTTKFAGGACAQVYRPA